MKSLRSDVQLLRPNVDRDAAFAHAWFTRVEGRATLLSMGNAANEIRPSTLNDQRAIMQEFIDLESAGKQITRVIIADGKTIGVVWIELFKNHGIAPPSIHIMIGNPDYRGKGIGRSVMQSAIQYICNVLHHKTIYSRHLANNNAIAAVNKTLGFAKDGATYKDDNGLEWQNVVLNMTTSHQ